MKIVAIQMQVSINLYWNTAILICLSMVYGHISLYKGWVCVPQNFTGCLGPLKSQRFRSQEHSECQASYHSIDYCIMTSKIHRSTSSIPLSSTEDALITDSGGQVLQWLRNVLIAVYTVHICIPHSAHHKILNSQGSKLKITNLLHYSQIPQKLKWDYNQSSRYICQPSKKAIKWC
jgi:hypothetical protein